MPGASPTVVVVGAGIVGASIAYHLARRGARVTLVDSGGPGRGVTARAFGWINVSHGVAAANGGLRGLALAEYRRLDRELAGRLHIAWHGALTWSADPAHTERMVRDHVAHGHDLRLLARSEVAALEPALIDVPDCAAYAVGEAAIDGAAAARTLADAAAEAGAQLATGAAVTALAVSGGRIAGIRLGEATIAADIVVIAAGTGAAALCRTAGVEIPVRVSPAIRLQFAGPPPPVGRIVSTPAFEIRPAGDRLIAAEDYLDDSVANGPDAVAARAASTIRAALRGGAGLWLDEVVVGHRAIPADGDPIVGRVQDGLYLAVMHAGVTMAPAVGRLAAEEIVEGVAVDDLSACRPGRFSG